MSVPHTAEKDALVAPLPPVIKEEPDVKPQRLHTTYQGLQSLLKWAGVGNEEHIITKVIRGNDPLSDYYADPEETREVIEIDKTSDSEDDLSKVSLVTDAGVEAEQLKATLQGLSNSHHTSAKYLGDLVKMVTGMSEHQLDDTVQRVASEMTAIQGWDYIMSWFDQKDIVTILVVGVHKYQEFEIMKGKHTQKDVTGF